LERPWLFDESSHAGPEHFDSRFVSGYDRKQGYPDPTEDLDIFARFGLGPTSAVIDLGAGTGQFALAAARRFGHVRAIDVSAQMLEFLSDRAAEANLANIDCIRAGFLSYQHDGPPADGVYTRNALHHLPDFWKAMALTRMARIMRTGAVLRIHDLIYDFQPSEAERILDRWLDHAVEDPAEGYTRADFIDHIRGEHSTFRWLLEPMLIATSFEIVTAEFRGEVYGAYTCVKR
jgi:ubiquinone/menaquinone biosynthesis C-methylase UbiE